MDLNAFIHRYVPSWAMTDHWPTFNVADVAICIGVGLMAVDMFTHRPPPGQSGAAEPRGAPRRLGGDWSRRSSGHRSGTSSGGASGHWVAAACS